MATLKSLEVEVERFCRMKSGSLKNMELKRYILLTMAGKWAFRA